MGARRLSRLREGDGLGARAGARARHAGSAQACACSTPPPAPATSPSAPPRLGADARRLGPHSRELRGGSPEAAARGVELEWVEADAEALPFGDGDFDVVTSSLGAMFAPDHQAVADELRVCRPGGTIGMIATSSPTASPASSSSSWRYAPPPPPGAQRADRVGQRGARSRAVRRSTRRARDAPGRVRRAGRDPARLRRAVQGDLRPGRRDLRESGRPARPPGRPWTGSSSSSPSARTAASGEGAELRYEYLLVHARTRGT